MAPAINNITPSGGGYLAINNSIYYKNVLLYFMVNYEWYKFGLYLCPKKVVYIYFTNSGGMIINMKQGESIADVVPSDGTEENIVPILYTLVIDADKLSTQFVRNFNEDQLENRPIFASGNTTEFGKSIVSSVNGAIADGTAGKKFTLVKTNQAALTQYDTTDLNENINGDKNGNAKINNNYFPPSYINIIVTGDSGIYDKDFYGNFTGPNDISGSLFYDTHATYNATGISVEARPYIYAIYFAIDDNWTTGSDTYITSHYAVTSDADYNEYEGKLGVVAIYLQAYNNVTVNDVAITEGKNEIEASAGADYMFSLAQNVDTTGVTTWSELRGIAGDAVRGNIEAAYAYATNIPIPLGMRYELRANGTDYFDNCGNSHNVNANGSTNFTTGGDFSVQF